MKKHALTLIGVLSLLLAAGSAFAQTIDIRGDIPFSFVANQATLAAGHYELNSLTEDGKMLSLRGPDGKPIGILSTNRMESVNAAENTKLVFNRYGDRYFLSQIWEAGRRSGRQLPMSAREKEVAMTSTGESVVVMARLR
jgi:hypothetical protein